MRESFGLPEEFRKQLSEEQRRTLRAEMQEAFSKRGLGSMERSYVYDDDSRVIKRMIQMGNLRQEMTVTYNEYGDEAWTVTNRSGSLFPGMPPLDDEPPQEVRYLYQYDSQGNWIEKMANRWPTRRQLTYYY